MRETAFVLAVLATALFSTIALLGTALFTLLVQFNNFRAEFTGFRGDVAGEFATIKADLARIEQKLDDHIASPHPAG
jgi:hypothetical protein